MHTPGKSFTNDEHKETPGGYVNTNREEINTVYELPKKNSNLNELEEKLKRFDFKYHCNFCPYFCFYKLYFSKTEKKNLHFNSL